ncbi:hypothetical protein [Vreelandella lionensis]|uniref:hypothetical protein n=1 Tax=Vreelandella lionensis TaxID=1144478 RepID=UPI0030F3EE8D
MSPPTPLAATAMASGLRSGYQRDHHITMQRLRGEKVRLRCDNLWQPVLSSVLAGGLLGAALWPVVDATLLLGWFTVLVVISGLRLLLAQRFKRLPALQPAAPALAALVCCGGDCFWLRVGRLRRAAV